MSNEQPVEVKCVNIEDFGRMFSMSRSAVDAAIKAGELKSFKKGRRVYIFIEDGLKWIKGEQ